MPNPKTATRQRAENAEHASQIATMKRLKLRAASWLAGVPASNFADRTHEIEPDSEGNYDARAVAEFAWKRREKGPQNDDERELVMKLADMLDGNLDHVDRFRLAQLFTELRKRHGSAGDSMLVDVLLARVMESPDFVNEPVFVPADKTDRELRSEYERSRAAAAKSDLRFEVVCEECEKVRNGTTWKKPHKKSNATPVYALCPSCS
jgi:predicted Rdx family selenoprotein